ncbi:AcrR family transcriptional regulator [Nocardioides cavernae]|uniref:AcrR family transcriptional regulator n=1 Tax=Nocardioides cavernae TaxID=1921566 RepID=A0A7Y9GZK3_9ACTN|nr:hypothetical protein [Nocardioides cavernae]NYE35207.1 AcrR family transcriptional regulator [Nocardioides cavernae]
MAPHDRSIPRSGAMFSRASLAKADLATNLAIPLLAEGGWAALTLRAMAHASHVTPQAIAAWFPSVAAMQAAVAGRYGDRWIAERSYLARRRLLELQPAQTTPDAVVAALLPQSRLEEVFDGVWLTILEASRWDDGLGAAVAHVLAREKEVVHDLVSTSQDPGPVLEQVRGVRAARVVHTQIAAGRPSENTSGSAG